MFAFHVLQSGNKMELMPVYQSINQSIDSLFQYHDIGIQVTTYNLQYLVIEPKVPDEQCKSIGVF